MTETDKLKALTTQLVRQEIARRNPVDTDVVAVLVGDRVGIADDGRLIALTESGVAEVGDETGYTKSLATMLDELAKARPALFRASKEEEAVRNPFVRGPHWNVTEQWVLLSQDPARAEHLQHLASLGKN